jgi:hypothetical protein
MDVGSVLQCLCAVEVATLPSAMCWSRVIPGMQFLLASYSLDKFLSGLKVRPPPIDRECLDDFVLRSPNQSMSRESHCKLANGQVPRSWSNFELSSCSDWPPWLPAQLGLSSNAAGIITDLATVTCHECQTSAAHRPRRQKYEILP